MNIDKSVKEREHNKFRANKEINDLMKEMQRIGVSKFREMFGQEMVDKMKKLAAEEKKTFSIRERIRLQGILKHDWPICEKCKNFVEIGSGKPPCPYDNDNYEKNISFEKNELASNPFTVEVCEMFDWKKT